MHGPPVAEQRQQQILTEGAAQHLAGGLDALHGARVDLDDRIAGQNARRLGFVSRRHRDHDDPTAAHVAVAVVDEWQGRGVGTILLEGLAVVAARNGVERFVGHVLAENAPMLELTRDVGGTTGFGEPGVREIEIAVPPAAAKLRDSPLYDLFRSAARPPDS